METETPANGRTEAIAIDRERPAEQQEARRRFADEAPAPVASRLLEDLAGGRLQERPVERSVEDSTQRLSRFFLCAFFATLVIGGAAWDGCVFPLDFEEEKAGARRFRLPIELA